VYYFSENTGINQWVMVDETKIPICFSDQSDNDALHLFRSLKWNVLYPNGEGNFIFKGTLYYGEKNSRKQMEDSGESCYEFDLNHWYLLTPFPVIKPLDVLDADYYEEMEHHLTDQHFKTVTLNRYQIKLDSIVLKNYERNKSE
jgi:hypothetical protein